MLFLDGTSRTGTRVAVLPYALPSLILAPLAVTFYVFVPKHYADLGTFSLGALGAVVFISRLWDAVTDPLIGILSDATRTSAGRRKPWLAGAVVPLCLSFIALFAVPVVPAEWHLAWFTVWSFLFFLFWTAYAIPYEALGQELVEDYDGRTTLFAFRDGAFLLGTLLAAIIPLGSEIVLAGFAPWARWCFLAAGYAFLLLSLTALLLAQVPQGSNRPLAPGVGVRKSLRSTLGNPHFRTLFSAYLVASFGGALPATLFLFYVESVLESSNGPAYLALYFAIGIASLPLWTRVARRWGKKQAWLAALSLNTTGFAGVFFLTAGQEALYAILISVSALGYGAALALPSSMQADIIDSEELRTGLRKEGEFLGVWSLAKKSVAALGAGAALWLLGTVGFESGSQTQTPKALFALRALYCLVPCLCSFAAMYLIRNYTLGREEHASITAALKTRRTEGR